MAPRAWWGSSWFVESQYDKNKYKTSLINRFWTFAQFLVKKIIQNTIFITLVLKIMKLPPRNSFIKGFATIPSVQQGAPWFEKLNVINKLPSLIYIVLFILTNMASATAPDANKA
jgi:hypothetical protein